MLRSKNRAATVLAAIAFLATLAGCSANQAGREAGGGFVAGAREEAEAWWEAKKPELIAVARSEGAAVAERIVVKAEGSLEAKVAEIRAKQDRGEPLSSEDKFYLYLAIAAPFAAALAKAGLRFVRGDSPTPPTP